MHFDFKGGELDSSFFDYIYSVLPCDYRDFIKGDGCIKNFVTDDGDFQYISVQSKRKYTGKTEIYASCSFEHFGAPLLVITDDIREDENGKPRYGLHYEAVAYENGINVWRVEPFPECRELPRKSTLLASLEFPIEENSSIDISLLVDGKRLTVTVNGRELTAEDGDIPESFRVGFTACEGINAFYSFGIKE